MEFQYITHIFPKHKFYFTVYKNSQYIKNYQKKQGEMNFNKMEIDRQTEFVLYIRLTQILLINSDVGVDQNILSNMFNSQTGLHNGLSIFISFLEVESHQCTMDST